MAKNENSRKTTDKMQKRLSSLKDHKAALKAARKPAAAAAAGGKAPAKAAPAAAPVVRKSTMGKAELDEFRKMLIEKRRGLLGDMAGIQGEAFRTNRQEGSGDLSNIPTHPADIGTDNFEQEFTLGLLESERTLLKEVNDALDRIDAGTFGVCEGTGMPIDKARLRARPWAKYCIEYARMIEKGQVAPPDQSSADSSEEDEPERHEGEEEEPAEEEVEE